MCTCCQLTSDDVQLIADSHHVNSLQLLRLDYNDLNPLIEPVLTLLSRLTAIQTLRMQACRIKYRNCLRCAESLAQSRTLRTWNFLDNVMYKVVRPPLFFTTPFLYLLFIFSAINPFSLTLSLHCGKNESTKAFIAIPV